MGYSTEFKGELKFTGEPTVKQLAKLKTILGQDARDHKGWMANKYCSYIDLELLEDFSGIKWNGAEKTYEMDECVNIVLREMRKDFPDFGLTGTLLAQGEEIDDRWALTIEDGIVKKTMVALTGKKITVVSQFEIRRA